MAALLKPPDTLGPYVKGFLAGIVLLAAAARLWGLTFGLPYVYHPDEQAYVAIAQHMFKEGDWNPHTFVFPSLFFDINALAYAPFYSLGSLAGRFHSRDDIMG